MEQLAVSCFSPREYAAFHTLAAGQKQEAFFSGWTRKEAYLKAVGDGMSQPLDQFDVSLVPGEAARLLQVAGNRWEHHRWSLQTLVPAAGYIGALAVEGHGWRLSRCEWPGASA
jgi:4'-phosphopantetheinyl transferase